MIKKIVFIRHAEPRGNILDINKGIKFLGRKDNYDIILPPKGEINHIISKLKDYSLVFSSPMKRCKQTLELITNKEIIEDKNLLEIDYGHADGLYFKDFENRYPLLLKDWENGEDSRFPYGENNLDVIKRAKKFINNLYSFDEENILVCTHNVFLRCLFGSSLKIPVRDWYKIQIPYFEPLPFVLENNRILYVGGKEQKERILKNILQRSTNGYFIALIPEERIYSKIYEAKKEIFHRFGNQKYLKDPPHCTLYISLTEDLYKVKEILENISLKEKKIRANISDEYKLFENDKLAGGGTSLALSFDINSSKSIISLQKKVINSLNELRKEEIHPRYKEHILSRQFMNNVKKYGFPFIGNIFIPHINFCCFNPPENAEKFKACFSIENLSGNMEFTKLGLFKLYPDDKVKLIGRFELQ